jgi:hypothetical protein
MPTLEEIRSRLSKDENESEESTKKEFNGKLNLTNEMLAVSLFNFLPEVIKKLMLNYRVCLAGGYIRDRLNGTQFGDYDLWIYGTSSLPADHRVSSLKDVIKLYYKVLADTDNAITFETPFGKLQLVKRIENDPAAIIHKFDFVCCKFALYYDKKPRLLKSGMAMKQALEKVLVPMQNMQNIENYGVTLKHMSKLHRKGYRIEEKHLYALLEGFEKEYPEGDDGY